MKGRKGHINTPEHNAKIAAAHRGKKQSPARAEQSRRASLGRKQTPEEIEKRRLANTGKKRSPEFCERMRELQANLTSEQKADRAEKLRQHNLNRDPAEKERLRQDLITRNKARKGEKREFPPVRIVGSTEPVFYVYEHWRPDRMECFYIGKGHHQRAHDMRNGRNKWHKFITQKLSSLGLVVDVRIIAKDLTERQAFDMETARIAFWKNDGADLCNLTIGGDGPSGRKHTEEWKQHMSKKLKGRVMSPEARANMSRAAIGNTRAKGCKRAPYLIEALRIRNTGRVVTEETRVKISVSKKGIGHPQTPESIVKIREFHLGRKRSDETRKKMSMHKKTDEHKNKLREKSIAWWANKKALEALNRE